MDPSRGLAILRTVSLRRYTLGPRDASGAVYLLSDLAIFHPPRSTHYLLKKVFQNSKYPVYSTLFVPQFRDSSGGVSTLATLTFCGIWIQIPDRDHSDGEQTSGPRWRSASPPPETPPEESLLSGLSDFSPTSKHTLPPKKGFLKFQIPGLFYTFCPAI